MGLKLCSSYVEWYSWVVVLVVWMSSWVQMSVQRPGILSQCHHMSLMDFMVSPPSCDRSVTEFGMPMRRSYFVPMRWMVIYEYEVPEGALNLSSTELPRPWSPWESSPSRKNTHGRTGNQTRDLMISSQKLWPLDHKLGQRPGIVTNFFVRFLDPSSPDASLVPQIRWWPL
jgi:hypothetical protein